MSASGDGLIRSHHAFRGVAAFLVLLYHFRDVTPSVGQTIDARSSFLSSGRIWVDFFFLLSGFILSHVYRNGFDSGRADSPNARDFYFARLARIYPLHVATLFAMILVELSAYAFRPAIADAFMNERKSWSSVIQHMTLTHAWVTMSRLEWNVPSWSISTEAFAYICFPILLLLMGHMNRYVRSLPLFVAAIIYLHTFFTFSDIGEQQPLLRCIAGFITGMMVYRLWFSYRSRLNTFMQPLQLASVVIVLTTLHLGWSQAIVLIFLAALIFSTADDSGPVAQVLAWKPLLILGSLSYSLYMTHWIIYRLYWMYGGYIFKDLASRYSPSSIYALKVGALTILSLALAYLSYHWLELPARSHFRRLLAR